MRVNEPQAVKTVSFVHSLTPGRNSVRLLICDSHATVSPNLSWGRVTGLSVLKIVGGMDQD